MMMNNPASLMVKSLTNNTTSFKCGCGLQFKDKISFKEHSLFVHSGQLQNGSSHYLTKFTLIVLPLLNIAQDIAKIHNRSRSIKAHAETQSLKTCPKRQVKNLQSDKNNNISNGTIILRKGKKIRRQIKAIEWNGFRLAINQASMAQDYYCGNCQINFAQPQAFIVHCIEVCQQLKNKKSSHFIGCIYDNQKSFNLSKQIVPNSTQTNPITKVKGVRGRKKKLQTEEFLINIDPFAYIMRKNVDHRNIPFKCGPCNQIFARDIYRKHFLTYHSQIIDASSTHLIIRYSKAYNIYISPHVKWIDEEVKYYCSCKAQKKMSMSKLVQHIMEVHKGISPRYF